MKKSKKLGPNFIIDNTVLTVRYRSHVFITPLFNRQIKQYTLSCEFAMDKFDPGFFKEYPLALVYIDAADKLYVCRVGAYTAVVTPEVVALDLTLVNIVPKEAWDMEHLTPRTFYNDIMENKRFFVRTGKSLDLMVVPLGISRRFGESDQSLRRRVLEYLHFKMGSSLTEDKIRELLSNKGGDLDAA